MSRDCVTVVVAGGTGVIASSIVAGLLRSTGVTFNVKVWTRKHITLSPAAGILANPKHPLEYIVIDYTNHEYLVSALHGVDVLLSAVHYTVALDIDPKLFEAAIVAQVPRFFPSIYDLDRSHPHVYKTAGDVYRDHFIFMERLERSAMAGQISWVVVMLSEFLNDDESMEWLGFDIFKREATLYDGGLYPTTGCTIEFVGDCFAAVIANSDIKNQRIPVAEVSYSGLELLRVLEEVTGETWTIVEDVTTNESIRRANKLLEAGDYRNAFLAHVLRLNFDGAGAANLEDGLDFMQDDIQRRSLRQIVESAVSKKLEMPPWGSAC